jgi:aldose 1-epimerase
MRRPGITRRTAIARAGVLGAAAAATPALLAQQYSARRHGDAIELRDAAHDTTVSVLPPVGNIGFEMTVKGHNVLRWPYASLDEFRKRPGFNGNPFLGPWANRLDEQAFYANGRRYAFDMELGNVRGAIPIHGLLTYSPFWTVTDVAADGRGARTTSRLEFFRHPILMAQFPFAHAIDMTYALEEGVMRVTTRIENLSTDPMPVSIGYHPYFQLTDSARDEWRIGVGARTHWLLAGNKVPTGETQPIESFFPDPRNVPLKEYDLDHVFGDLVRDGRGRAVMTLRGRRQELDVELGPNYRAMVIYAPRPTPPGEAGRGAGGGRGSAPDRNFICFEPMVGITNAMNAAHKGLYKELQSVAPGGTWEESFWVRVRGF